MMRLVTFGCSITYGHGLEDCYNKKTNGPGPLPSSFSWPKLLADKINLPVVNRSIPGSSNKQILYEILNFDFEQTDIVVVMWSFLNRYCFIKENSVKAVFPTDAIDSSIGQQLFEDFDRYYGLIKDCNHAKLYLDQQKIKNMHLHVNYLNFSQFRKFKWDKVKFSKINMASIKSKHPCALDIKFGNPHPGPLAHAECAELIYNDLKDMCFIS